MEKKTLNILKWMAIGSGLAYAAVLLKDQAPALLSGDEVDLGGGHKARLDPGKLINSAMPWVAGNEALRACLEKVMRKKT